ncbi:unnamed protein product [Caenorhabditis angaria]|uniref:TFIID subunit TAF5 NTD2 domain-containing protein n=1 Tax=Caenorhabditis angaria TaxID=860376 RepID=A0A9P1I3V3_9PELO|nr:unnamed protein product [Caenorhabditis angaria]
MNEIFQSPVTPEILQMMMGYLRRNGFTETEEQLSREATNLLGGKSEFSSAAGLPPEEAITVEFETFMKHGLNNPSEIVQVEYSQILFPVFAHSYISLVERQSRTSRAFFDRFSRVIPECYKDYVYQLSLVEDLITLRACEHVHTLRANKFLVRFSRPTSLHLDLVMARLVGIKNIIAKHVMIDPTETTAKNTSTIETQMGGILGQIGKHDRRHKIKRKMKGKEWRDAGKKTATMAPTLDRIPLPPISEHLREDRRNHQREVAKMALVSADSPVSICMHTVINAPIGVSACDFSDDSNFIVMGLQDSSILVNAMNPMNKIRKLRDMEYLDKIDIETADNINEQMFDLQASTSNVRFTGHGATVFSVNFSPDRRLLLSSAGDKTIRLWSMDTQKNVVIYRTPAVVWDAKFCNRGYYFATGNSDKTASVWCTDRMHPVRLFADSYGDVECIDFHPNCNYIAGGSFDRYIRVWDMLTGTCVRIFSGHKSNVIAVKFSPDGRYLISLDSVGNVMVWDLAYQRLFAAELTGNIGTKGCITFTRDGGVFAVSHGNSNISLYSLDALVANISATAAQTDLGVEPKVNMDGFNIGTYPTKHSSVIGLHFSRRNLLSAFGCFGQ